MVSHKVHQVKSVHAALKHHEKARSIPHEKAHSVPHEKAHSVPYHVAFLKNSNRIWIGKHTCRKIWVFKKPAVKILNNGLMRTLTQSMYWPFGGVIMWWHYGKWQKLESGALLKARGVLWSLDLIPAPSSLSATVSFPTGAVPHYWSKGWGHWCSDTSAPVSHN